MILINYRWPVDYRIIVDASKLVIKSTQNYTNYIFKIVFDNAN